MNKSTAIIGVGLAIAFTSGVWTDITPDLTALGVSEHITHIGTVVFERGTQAVAAVATLMHVVIPMLNKAGANNG